MAKNIDDRQAQSQAEKSSKPSIHALPALPLSALCAPGSSACAVSVLPRALHSRASFPALRVRPAGKSLPAFQASVWNKANALKRLCR